MADVTLDERRIAHIFRDADGLFREDTSANQQALIEVASRDRNFVGTDRFGNDWFAELRDDGTELWTRVRAGKITNGGANRTPRYSDRADLTTRRE
jgi:filamentous hemagglutinin